MLACGADHTMNKAISTQVGSRAGVGRVEIDDAELRVTGGPDRGQKWTLSGDCVSIGSSPECDVVLHDTTVSARHAEIRQVGEGFVLEDLGSRNGVLLEGWPVERIRLVHGLRLQLGKTALEVRKARTRTTKPLAEAGRFGSLVFASVKLRALVAQLEALAPSDATILIEGETGTGKEIVAQSIHQRSARAGGPFVVFDCGAVAPTLMASALFGHERGAFTGADRAQPGLLEQADGGTLFLDEIGELPLELQPMLLRAIETRCSRRIGAHEEVHHDVRIVAATNRKLEEEVRARRFRSDLFFRLAVARVRIPPLRDRPEDIPLLANELASHIGVTLGPEIVALFREYRWPGNVRELRNAIERIAALAVGKDARSTRELLGIDESSAVAMQDARREAIEHFERDYLERVLAAAGGNLSGAARLARVSRQYLTRLAARYGFRLRDRSDDIE
ncbi:MAG: Flagellar regulatory protein FleQ [Myxococcales bacterium]|nr:Flagellar regulatory protein FleQ [Myxococcales bacterium]